MPIAQPVEKVKSIGSDRQARAIFKVGTVPAFKHGKTWQTSGKTFAQSISINILTKTDKSLLI